MKAQFVADDGKIFDTASAAREHEKQSEFEMLEGLTASNLTDALDDPLGDLAMAFTKFAGLITKKRRALPDAPKRPRKVLLADKPFGTKAGAGETGDAGK